MGSSARPIQGPPLPAAQPLSLSGIPPWPPQFNNAPDTFEPKKFFIKFKHYLINFF